MTTFERDYNAIKTNWMNAREILEKRAAAIKALEKELKMTRNGFRAQCICQDIDRLKKQYNSLNELV